MNISFMSFTFPFPKLTIDSSKTEFEIFSTNFRTINHQPIIHSIESKTEFKKSVNLSSVLRCIGNNHFTNGEYNMAFQFYHRSISSAPVNSPEYALALANRSALFYTLKNYKRCLKDIEYVLKLNYPENKLLKLYFRQTECCLKLNQNYDALKSWANATGYANQFKCLPNPQQPETIQSQIMNIIRSSDIHNKDMKEDLQYPKPALKNGENEKFRYASNSVELKINNNTKGPLVVAKVDIEQGDVLFVEEPYSAVLLNNPSVSCIFCSNCFTFSPTNIPCKTCAVRFYCSDECRQISWEKSHQWECFGERKQILTIYTRLVLNILFEASHHNFSTIVEADSRYGNKRNNYAFVNQLATNKSELTNDEIYAFTQYAIYMVLYLKEFTDYFTWLHCKPMFAKKPMPELYDFIGGIVLKTCMQVYSNHDEIFDTDVYVDESPEIDIDGMGCGLYVSSSMINHSCEPNTLFFFDKFCKVVRAIKKIPKNTEITIDYLKYRNWNTQTCKRTYLNHFKFKCTCPKCCISTYPRNEKMPWLCSKCNGKAFIEPSNACGQCLNPACKHSFNSNAYRTLELVIGPNLLAAALTSDSKIVEGTLSIMKKIYHRENIKFTGYYLTAYALYFETRDLEKCVEVCKDFIKFSEQFDDINEIKIRAYLRLTTALTMYITKMKVYRIPNQDAVLSELYASLNKTKRLLTYYVPPTVIATYENHISNFLKELLAPFI